MPDQNGLAVATATDYHYRMPLSLPDVTLCAVTAINHELTVRAMEECLRHCSFADVVLISDRPVQAPFRVEIMPSFASGGLEYAPFVCQNLTKYTTSAFNLLVQYDGYIVDPSAWSDRFLEYDYIGAKWPWHKPGRRVGNSGFCLRSKKLLDILSTIALPPTGEFLDDLYICHAIRDWLEDTHGIRIAPEEIADSFAYERHTPDRPTFGFHGIFNFWRHAGHEEMKKIPYLLDNFYVPSRGFLEVLLHYYSTHEYGVFGSWYWRLREFMGKQPMENHMLNYMNDLPYIQDLIKIGEKTDKSRQLFA